MFTELRFSRPDKGGGEDTAKIEYILSVGYILFKSGKKLPIIALEKGENTSLSAFSVHFVQQEPPVGIQNSPD